MIKLMQKNYLWIFSLISCMYVCMWVCVCWTKHCRWCWQIGWKKVNAEAFIKIVCVCVCSRRDNKEEEREKRFFWLESIWSRWWFKLKIYIHNGLNDLHRRRLLRVSWCPQFQLTWVPSLIRRVPSKRERQHRPNPLLPSFYLNWVNGNF